MSQISKYIYILGGFTITLGVSCLCFIVGIILGLMMGSIKFLYKNNMGVKFIDLYENFFINTPIISQVFLFYFLIPLSSNLVTVSILVLALNSSAHVSLLVVESLTNIGNVYWETAYSLGFNPKNALIKIFIREIFFNNMKSFFTEFVALIKESSILSFFGVGEICLRSKEIGMQEYNMAPYILFSSGVYFFFITGLNVIWGKYFKKRC